MRLPKRAERQRFWEQIRLGDSLTTAAAAAGVPVKTAQRWFGQAGGVLPAKAPAASKTRCLSISEREDIHGGVERGESIREIARGLQRAPSTVLRELRRNMRHSYRTRSKLDPAPVGRPRWREWDYRPSLAEERARRAATRPKPAKLSTHLALKQVVATKLRERLSPEQIAAELRYEYPEQPEMWVSHETIYQSIYVQGRGALRRELAQCLRTGRALRHPHRRADQRRQRIPGMVNISQRPPEAEDRAVPGHWEGDLILGKQGRSAIGTLVERSTRYLMLLHLPGDHSAAAVEEAMLAATKRLPVQLWKSLTWDQGSEMTNHAQISIATGLQVYFCDPAKPWQRGSNENTNGLLRQYFPKGTDLSIHDAEHLEFVAAQMNRRPRKTLGWRKPREALAQLLSEAGGQSDVAPIV